VGGFHGPDAVPMRLWPELGLVSHLSGGRLGLLCYGLLVLRGTCKFSKCPLKCDLTLSFASSEKQR